METIAIAAARRLALVRAGLLKPELTGFPKRAAGRSQHARKAALWKAQKLYVLSQRFEAANVGGAASSEDGAAVGTALARYAGALGLQRVES